MMKKVYDIVITKGEFKGYFRMDGIRSREIAEMLKEKYFDASDEIVERDVEITPEEQEVAELFGWFNY